MSSRLVRPVDRISPPGPMNGEIDGILLVFAMTFPGKRFVFFTERFFLRKKQAFLFSHIQLECVSDLLLSAEIAMFW